MMLEPSDAILCLVNNKHHFISSKTLKKQWKPLLENTMRLEPYMPVQFHDTVNFTFGLTVVSNIYLHDFQLSLKTADEIREVCSKSFGGGIMCTLSTGIQKLFKFHHFIDHNDQIQFWREGSSSCIGTLYPSLAKLTDPSHIAPTFSNFFDKVYGDKTATRLSIHKHENVMLHLDYNEKIKTVKKLDVSTRQLK